MLRKFVVGDDVLGRLQGGGRGARVGGRLSGWGGLTRRGFVARDGALSVFVRTCAVLTGGALIRRARLSLGRLRILLLFLLAALARDISQRRRILSGCGDCCKRDAGDQERCLDEPVSDEPVWGKSERAAIRHNSTSLLAFTEHQ